MSITTVVRLIDAPIGEVFHAVADFDNFSDALPHIVRLEFLTAQKKGVGTRFRETRLHNGREATTLIEVTEYIEAERVRLVTDQGGTVWDSVFDVREVGFQTELTLTVEATPYKLFAKLVTPFVRATVARALESDLDEVKAYCER
ncbi:MAG: SRPBCC family protein [Deltaproteobacteria bacterium]|nr:SRPBCC family protein [Deltaproteobacteria bacterium]